MKRVVLDASAMMTFLEDRPGADKVEELMGQAIAGKRELLMSVLNWGEVYYSVWLAHGKEAALSVLSEVAQLPIELIDAELDLVRVAAEFRAQYKLPYADCFAAALAKLLKAAVAASDRDFVRVKGEITLLEI